MPEGDDQPVLGAHESAILGQRDVKSELAQPATRGDLAKVLANVRRVEGKIPDLNGTLPALKRVAAMEPQLQKIVALADPLMLLVQGFQVQQQTATDWEGFRRIVARITFWKQLLKLKWLGAAAVGYAAGRLVENFMHIHHLLGF